MSPHAHINNPQLTINVLKRTHQTVTYSPHAGGVFKVPATIFDRSFRPVETVSPVDGKT